MKAKVYNAEKVIQFFEDYNIGPWKLGAILDIPGIIVKKYLLDGYQIDGVWAEKIDIAIDIIRSKWTIGSLNTENYKKLLRSVTDAIKAKKAKEEEKCKDAVEVIMLIITDKDPDEFITGEDSISYKAGLEHYSTEEFIRRIKEKVRFTY